MSLDLDTLEQRIIGVLIEKQMTVPDAYPLTINALVSGCNQKSNRDPHMEVFDYEVEGALRALMDRNWAARVERDTGRALRYAHMAKEQLGAEPEDLAILSELLCRGPQSHGELKTRCARMARIGDKAAVEERLQALAARPVPYVTKLPKRPREQMQRWCHLLDGRTPDEAIAAGGEPPSAAGAVPAPAADTSADDTPAADPSSVSPVATGHDIADIADRLELLEALVSDLTRRLDTLEGR